MSAHPDFKSAIHYALQKLRDDLHPKYTYHGYSHTAHDVLPAVTRLAKHSGLSESDTRLLEVAAAFHDLGFLVTVKGHERESVRMAGEVLPRFGFSADQITHIQQTIMATQLPQTPLDLLGQLIADADLDLLGREDFFVLSDRLQEETAVLGNPTSALEWNQKQLAFLSNHTYFSPAAHQLRDEQKQRNIEKLREIIARLSKPRSPIENN
ncbi:MAG: HD domain-containing protein [Ardenticatenaceae bacterium]|nr:HD domain-containing protein [Ardenticatenaceae bacterium]